MFTILFTINQAKFHHSSEIITEVGLFDCVIYYSADTVCASLRINNTAKWANSANYGTSELGFGSLDGTMDDQHNCVGFVELSQIFPMYEANLFGIESFDEVQALAGREPLVAAAAVNLATN